MATSLRKGIQILPLVALAVILLAAFSASASAQASTPVCFWSAQGPVCVERTIGASVTGLDSKGLLGALLVGPTSQERARGLWSAIPAGTRLDDLQVQPDRTVIVRLRVPPDALRSLDSMTFEIIVNQIGATLEPLRWRDLRIQTWDPGAGAYVPLAAFLPPIPAPRKETVPGGEEAVPFSATYIGQPPAPGQAQPRGALTGKTVYVSAGHGWQWSGYTWRTQRPSYPRPPYTGPIIEDHNNAEAVDQYLLQYLWNAGAQVWPVRERDMNGAEVIVDNDALGPGTAYLEAGVWATSTYTGYQGRTYRYATTVNGTATATAAWAAALPADGRYAVYVWYQPGSNRAPDARYTVYHAGGETVVTVNQQHHGSTWHYLGTYGFRVEEEARVTLDNRSSVAGKAVIADAVRFGGGTFDDLTGIQTTAPYAPGKPWWEVAAFYHTQRMGVDPDDCPDFNDVIARPIYARWEHAGTGDDAVYVSWHTNGYDGAARGTETYVHNSEVLTRTEGSLKLQHAVHTEVIHDIRAGWDPTWADRGEKRENLGELRLLWDDDPSARMPGTLIEVAFHDNPTDTNALKEPTFQMLAARAVYQGIVHYFEGRDGIDLLELPEPPTHLAVQDVGNGQVRVSWRPSPTDAIGLVGDAATGYRVYTSTDGLGWSNGAPVTATTAYTFTGLSPGQLLFVRVSATNDGGESFSTETLGAGVGNDAEILLVNGFDRLNRTMLVAETDPVEGPNQRMFLDRMNRYDYVVQHGQALSEPFDSASNEAVRDGLVSLGDYALVDWILGEESAPDQTLDATERAGLTQFLGDGGALFLSGTEVGWHLDDQGGDPDFYHNVLRSAYAGDDAGTYAVAPASGSIFAGLAPFRFDAPGMYDADYPDQLTPVNGSTAALVYQGGNGGTAAVQYQDGCQRLVYFGFPFETIWPSQRPVVMGRALGFLDECAVLPQTTVLLPVDGEQYRKSPPLSGLAAGMYGVERVEVALCRQVDGNCWDGTGWVNRTAWLVATGTANWTYSLPPLEPGEYGVLAQAWDSQGRAEALPAAVSFRVVDMVFLPLVMRGYK